MLTIQYLPISTFFFPLKPPSCHFWFCGSAGDAMLTARGVSLEPWSNVLQPPGTRFHAFLVDFQAWFTAHGNGVARPRDLEPLTEPTIARLLFVSETALLS